jgi:hypothetical protein
MADEMDSLGSLVDEVKHAEELPGYPLSLMMTDAQGYFGLSAHWTASPGWHTPLRLPEDAALDTLIGQLFPPETGGATPDVVTPMVEAAVDLGIGLPAALNELAQQDWASRWEVVRRLGSNAPTLGGQTYLEIVEPMAEASPNLDPKVTAALLTGLLALGGRTVATGAVSAWIRLTDLLLVLDTAGQLEVLAHLGVPAGAAEGTLAMMISEAFEAGLGVAPFAGAVVPGPVIPPGWLDQLSLLWSSINTARTDFLDWLQPRDQPYGYYLGTQVHLAIAAAYRAAHAPHMILGGGGPMSKSNIWTNVTPVMTILGALQTKFAFQGSGIKQALAVSRPDIFEFGFAHGMPPGWVFEIKPAAGGAGAALAAAEAAFYSTVLTLCDIPAVPGPVTAAGVSGVIPVAGGWVAYVSPLPGTILYRYRKAPDESLEARGQVRVYKAVRDRTERWVRASGAAADGVKAGLLAAIVAVLLEYGWVVIFV